MDPAAQEWFEQRTLPVERRSVAELAALKKASKTTVAVCLPALDEAGTIGAICAAIRDELVAPGLVDELIVMDSGSTDRTAAIARESGARVFRASDVLPEAGSVDAPGKGESLWKSLSVTSRDVIAWLDSDTRNFHPRFVTGLIAPLLDDPDLGFVKAFYERPLASEELKLPAEGGRVTEIAVRPLLNLFFPRLAGFVQPLSGEYAGRASLLKQVPFFAGYAVDIGLLIDIVDRFGLRAVAQADLGERVHRNRDVAALGRMAFEITGALMKRLDEDAVVKLSDPLPDTITQFVPDGDRLRAETFVFPVTERPPIGS